MFYCGSDHELLIAKFRLKLKKVGKTTSPFRYDLNQIPYDYTVEVTNRFKGFDQIECLKNYVQRFLTLYRRQGSRPSPRRRNAFTSMTICPGQPGTVLMYINCPSVTVINHVFNLRRP